MSGIINQIPNTCPHYPEADLPDIYSFLNQQSLCLRFPFNQLH